MGWRRQFAGRRSLPALILALLLAHPASAQMFRDGFELFLPPTEIVIQIDMSPAKATWVATSLLEAKRPVGGVVRIDVPADAASLVLLEDGTGDLVGGRFGAGDGTLNAESTALALVMTLPIDWTLLDDSFEAFLDRVRASAAFADLVAAIDAYQQGPSPGKLLGDPDGTLYPSLRDLLAELHTAAARKATTEPAPHVEADGPNAVAVVSSRNTPFGIAVRAVDRNVCGLSDLTVRPHWVAPVRSFDSLLGLFSSPTPIRQSVALDRGTHVICVATREAEPLVWLIDLGASLPVGSAAPMGFFIERADQLVSGDGVTQEAFVTGLAELKADLAFRVYVAISGVSLIPAAGDVGGPLILEALAELANNDPSRWNMAPDLLPGVVVMGLADVADVLVMMADGCGSSGSLCRDLARKLFRDTARTAGLEKILRTSGRLLTGVLAVPDVIDLLRLFADMHRSPNQACYTVTVGADGTTAVEPYAGDLAGRLCTSPAQAEAPVAVADALVTLPGQRATLSLLENDYDLDGTLRAHTLSVWGPTAAHGALGIGAEPGTLDYLPDPGFEGTDGFDYRVQDNDGQWSNIAQVSVRVSAGEPPIARDDEVTTDQNQRVWIDVLANDEDTDGQLDASTVRVVSGPDHGDATVDLSGRVRYAPVSSFFGTDTFTYRVDDNDGFTSDDATVTITVEEATIPMGHFRDCPTCPRLIRIPDGSFQMGDSAGVGSGDELPVHTVHLPDFAMGVYEVTWSEWDACVAASACDGASVESAGGDEGWGRDRRPVINVSRSHAIQYVEWLSEVTGRNYRLPSEAEWEYAARSLSAARYWWGDDPPDACDSTSIRGARFGSCAPARTDTVGSYAANWYGLFDVHGNVAEWVSDCYQANYQGAPSDSSARVLCNGGETPADSVIQRGGSWASAAIDLRSARRDGAPCCGQSDATGFRVVRELP